MDFKVWDEVRWKTESSGISVKKKGEIILILEPGEDFFVAVEGLKKRYKFTIIYSGVSIRDHKSYIVLVKEKNKSSRLYWPYVADLKKIKKTKRRMKKNEKIESGKDWAETANL